MRRVSWKFCFVATLIVFFSHLLIEPLGPSDDPTAPLDLIMYGVKPLWLAAALALAVIVVLVVLSSYVISEAWNRIGPKLFPGVGELTWGEAYVVILVFSLLL